MHLLYNTQHLKNYLPLPNTICLFSDFRIFYNSTLSDRTVNHSNPKGFACPYHEPVIRPDCPPGVMSYFQVILHHLQLSLSLLPETDSMSSFPIQTLSPLSTTLQEKSFQTRQLKILQKKGLYHIFTALWFFFRSV